MPQPSPYQHIPEASFIVLLSMLFSCDNIVCIFWFIYIALFFVFGSLLNLFYDHLQSTVCLKQLGYGILELVLISIFPELRDLVMDTHEKMRA